MNLKNKKGQTVTIFLVIGLIIIISALLIIILNREEAKEPLETGAGKAPEFAGQTELKNYVDECLQDSVLQGLEIMRLQGGYIEIPDGIETLTVKDKENKQITIIDGSRKVVIDENGIGNEVPYWLTKDSLSVPSIDLMEFHLEQYVAFELENCVDDFKPFKEQKFEVEYGDINTEVAMETAVVTKVNFPVTAKKEDIEFDIDEFIYSVPINMELIANMALDIVGFENTFAFLEENTKNLISLYSGIDEQRLPPFSQSFLSLSCDSVKWTKPRVKEMLKGIFKKNIPFLKIGNTNFKKIESSSATKGIYDSFIYTFFEETYPSLSIDFSYRQEWEFIDYDIKPSAGDSLVPDSYKFKLPLVATLCIFDYAYKYTVDYPVLVEIKDSKSAKVDPKSEVYFKDGGYNFQYVIDSYLCGNQNRICTGKPNFAVDNNQIIDTDIIFEGINTTALPETLFCNENQRISEDITIDIINSDTNEKLKNMGIYYQCGSYRNNCFIGSTDEDGILKAKFPLCINGVIYTQENDYSDIRELLTVYDEEERNLTFMLEPYKEVAVEVKKVDLPSYMRNYFETGNLNPEGFISKLNAKESADISISGQNSILYYYPDQEGGKIKLGSGNYGLNINLYGNLKLRDSMIGDQKLKGFTGRFPSGLTNINWNIGKNEIKDKVVFYALSNFDPEIFGSGAFEDIDDNILSLNGTLSAELLYLCEKKINETDGQYYCDYDQCSFVDIDGTNNYEFADDEENCERAFDVRIEKEQYEQHIRPRFS